MLDRMPHQSIEQIQALNARLGHCWFSRANMRSFNTRLGLQVYSGSFGLFFVTSDKQYNEPREYSVRYATAHGNVETFGKFGMFASNAAAQRYAEQAANLSLYLDQAEPPKTNARALEIWNLLKETQARELRRAQDEIADEIAHARATLAKYNQTV